MQLQLTIFLQNAVLNKQFEAGIIKTEISYHFPVFPSTDRITSGEIKNRRTLLHKRTTNTATKQNFKSIFARKNCDYIIDIDNPNEAYCNVLRDFFTLHEEAFPN